jgi:hypothetical protein
MRQGLIAAVIVALTATGSALAGGVNGAWAGRLKHVRRCTRENRADEETRAVVRGDHDDRRFPHSLHEPCRLDAIEAGHLDVHQGDVRLEIGGEADSLPTVACLAANLPTPVLDDRPNVESRQRLIFCDQNPSGASTVVFDRGECRHAFLLKKVTPVKA